MSPRTETHDPVTAPELTEPADDGVRQCPTEEAIAQRAYEISQSAGSGSDEENWNRAERELRGFVEQRNSDRTHVVETTSSRS
jgi:Protein of unknown function (DUF2934)